VFLSVFQPKKPNPQASMPSRRRFRAYLGKGVGAIDWKNNEKTKGKMMWELKKV